MSMATPLETEEVLLPDGTRYLTASFVLINGSFTTGAFVSNDTVYIFDGLTNDVFTATVAVRSSSEGPLLSTSNINLKKLIYRLIGRKQMLLLNLPKLLRGRAKKACLLLFMLVRL